MLYKCKYFSILKIQIFLKHTKNENELFSTDLKSSIDKIIEFTFKAKFFDELPQIRKCDPLQIE